MSKPIVLVIGTRAEAIKLLPVHSALKKAGFNTILCATFQHLEMLQQVFDIFNEQPDFNLGIMKHDQDLFYLQNAILEKTKEVYLKVNPKLVIVHGDTTTTMGSALSAFYLQIPIAHIEAGLRTGNMLSPFPEEMNRKVVAQLATYHFTPTALATANILLEGIPRNRVFCTGNPIVDALNWIKNKISLGEFSIDPALKAKVEEAKRKGEKIVLVTAHRRESFNGGLIRIFEAIKKFSATHEGIKFFLPAHPNPNVKKAIEHSKINTEKSIEVMSPLSYKDLIYLLSESSFVATDSGGIQEEAVSLGRRVLCLRDVTERMEGVWEGYEKLVGTNTELIMEALEEFYSMKNPHIKSSSIYGDGNACERIVSILKTQIESKHAITRNNILLMEQAAFFERQI